MVSHAMVPTVHALGDVHRVYFSGRDSAGRSRVGWFELSLDSTPSVRGVSPSAVLEPGPLGTFDDSGITATCVVRHGERMLLYYSGWSLGVTVPFYLAAGVAVSVDGGATFRRHSDAPLLERTAIDPYLTAAPWVLVEGDRWRMWYVSGSRWGLEPAGAKHWYHIRYAESPDGLSWERRGTVCIDYASPAEHALARPCVVRDADLYRMWYSYRGAANRIGYAESRDGVQWRRRDAEAGIDVSPSGWDSEMVTYPCVFDHGRRRYMLYNGNQYGKSGVGLAVLE
jgi:hypothetical protein